MTVLWSSRSIPEAFRILPRLTSSLFPMIRMTANNTNDSRRNDNGLLSLQPLVSLGRLGRLCIGIYVGGDGHRRRVGFEHWTKCRRWEHRWSSRGFQRKSLEVKFWSIFIVRFDVRVFRGLGIFIFFDVRIAVGLFFCGLEYVSG